MNIKGVILLNTTKVLLQNDKQPIIKGLRTCYLKQIAGGGLAEKAAARSKHTCGQCYKSRLQLC